MICYFGTHMKGLGKQLAKFMERIREKKKNTDERKGMVIDPNSRRGLSPHIAKDIGWIDPLGGGRRTMIDMPPIGWLW